MNKTRNDNKYKFYCTSDPATWETFESGVTDTHITGSYGARTGNQRREEGKEMESGRRRNERGEVTRRPDNGWEGRREGMRINGNKVNGNSNTQTEAYKHSNVIDAGSNIRDKGLGAAHKEVVRKYKQGGLKDTRAAQTTLNAFWAGKEKDLRSWLEEMEELEGLESLKAKGSQDSALSYV
jgi:hypothetical protein